MDMSLLEEEDFGDGTGDLDDRRSPKQPGAAAKGTARCPSCAFRCASSLRLRGHIQRHLSRAERGRCGRCAQATRSRRHATLHRVACAAGLPRQLRLGVPRLVGSVWAGRSLFSCPRCPKRARYPATVQLHFIARHRDHLTITEEGPRIAKGRIRLRSIELEDSDQQRPIIEEETEPEEDEDEEEVEFLKEGQKALTYPCPTCPYVTTKLYQLTKHLRSRFACDLNNGKRVERSEAAKEDIPCASCAYRAPSAQALTRHLSRSACGRSGLTLESTLGRLSQTPSLRTLSSLSVASDSLNDSVSSQSSQQTTGSSLDESRTALDGEASFACKDCPYATVDAERLARHQSSAKACAMWRKRSLNMTCPKCAFVFDHPATFNRHVQGKLCESADDLTSKAARARFTSYARVLNNASEGTACFRCGYDRHSPRELILHHRNGLSCGMHRVRSANWGRLLCPGCGHESAGQLPFLAFSHHLLQVCEKGGLNLVRGDPSECPDCRATYWSSELLRRHRNSDGVGCLLTKQGVIKAQANVHADPSRSHKCDACGEELRFRDLPNHRCVRKGYDPSSVSSVRSQRHPSTRQQSTKTTPRGQCGGLGCKFQCPDKAEMEQHRASCVGRRLLEHKEELFPDGAGCGECGYAARGKALYGLKHFYAADACLLFKSASDLTSRGVHHCPTCGADVQKRYEHHRRPTGFFIHHWMPAPRCRQPQLPRDREFFACEECGATLASEAKFEAHKASALGCELVREGAVAGLASALQNVAGFVAKSAPRHVREQEESARKFAGGDGDICPGYGCTFASESKYELESHEEQCKGVLLRRHWEELFPRAAGGRSGECADCGHPPAPQDVYKLRHFYSPTHCRLIRRAKERLGLGLRVCPQCSKEVVADPSKNLKLQTSQLVAHWTDQSKACGTAMLRGAEAELAECGGCEAKLDGERKLAMHQASELGCQVVLSEALAVGKERRATCDECGTEMNLSSLFTHRCGQRPKTPSILGRTPSRTPSRTPTPREVRCKGKGCDFVSRSSEDTQRHLEDCEEGRLAQHSAELFPSGACGHCGCATFGRALKPLHHFYSKHGCDLFRSAEEVYRSEDRSCPTCRAEMEVMGEQVNLGKIATRLLKHWGEAAHAACRLAALPAEDQFFACHSCGAQLTSEAKLSAHSGSSWGCRLMRQGLLGVPGEAELTAAMARVPEDITSLNDLRSASSRAAAQRERGVVPRLACRPSSPESGEEVSGEEPSSQAPTQPKTEWSVEKAQLAAAAEDEEPELSRKPPKGLSGSPTGPMQPFACIACPYNTAVEAAFMEHRCGDLDELLWTAQRLVAQLFGTERQCPLCGLKAPVAAGPVEKLSHTASVRCLRRQAIRALFARSDPAVCPGCCGVFNDLQAMDLHGGAEAVCGSALVRWAAPAKALACGRCGFSAASAAAMDLHRRSPLACRYVRLGHWQ